MMPDVEQLAKLQAGQALGIGAVVTFGALLLAGLFGEE